MMDASWKEALAVEFERDYFKKLLEFVRVERSKGAVYPPPGEVFTAFNATPLDKVRVVILGQDPYHNVGQAHGLSFSVRPGTMIPPSLYNIRTELRRDLGIDSESGYLLPWATQGVFLLNSVLTVRAHEAGSHRDQGWETFTDAVIKILDERGPLVFVLWGRYARDKAAFIDSTKHSIIESAHPSPMSADRGFFGSRPFSKINQALTGFGQPPIDWKL